MGPNLIGPIRIDLVVECFLPRMCRVLTQSFESKSVVEIRFAQSRVEVDRAPGCRSSLLEDAPGLLALRTLRRCEIRDRQVVPKACARRLVGPPFQLLSEPMDRIVWTAYRQECCRGCRPKPGI